MSGLSDTTTGLTNDTGLYWHVGLDGGDGVPRCPAGAVLLKDARIN